MLQKLNVTAEQIEAAVNRTEGDKYRQELELKSGQYWFIPIIPFNEVINKKKFVGRIISIDYNRNEPSSVVTASEFVSEQYWYCKDQTTVVIYEENKTNVFKQLEIAKATYNGIEYLGFKEIAQNDCKVIIESYYNPINFPIIAYAKYSTPINEEINNSINLVKIKNIIKGEQAITEIYKLNNQEATSYKALRLCRFSAEMYDMMKGGESLIFNINSSKTNGTGNLFLTVAKDRNLNIYFYFNGLVLNDDEMTLPNGENISKLIIKDIRNQYGSLEYIDVYITVELQNNYLSINTITAFNDLSRTKDYEPVDQIPIVDIDPIFTFNLNECIGTNYKDVKGIIPLYKPNN